MTELLTFLALLSVHTAADFCFQTDWQAKNKWNNWIALSSHVGVYAGMFTITALFIAPTFLMALAFGVVTFVTHIATDKVTSQYTHHFAGKNEWHNFFVIVGVDQLIHAWTLALTYLWLLR